MAEAEEALIPKLAEEARREPKTREPRRLTEIITAQLEALRVYHRALLDSDDIEAVHKMRVTTRRLQASLDLLENQLNVRGLKTRLRTWRRALSRVRNYDVFLELIAKEEPARGRARKEQLQLIKGILQQRRAPCHKGAAISRTCGHRQVSNQARLARACAKGTNRRRHTE